MNRILLLCGDTNRARSYASVLKNMKATNVVGLLYGIDKSKTKIKDVKNLDIDTKDYLNSIDVEIPILNKDVESIFIDNKWKYSSIEEQNVNHEKVINAIEAADCDYVVFAGYGGQILSKEHFFKNKKYIHCHPGWLPLERGSTTLYYSILHNRVLSVTGFFMTEKIDQGNMILRNSYSLPKKLVDIDIWVDNALRADVLLKLLLLLNDTYKGFHSTEKEENEEQEYFIIHPLLKHISLLSLK